VSDRTAGILVVDDVPATARLLEPVLGSAGYGGVVRLGSPASSGRVGSGFW